MEMIQMIMKDNRDIQVEIHLCTIKVGKISFSNSRTGTHSRVEDLNSIFLRKLESIMVIRLHILGFVLLTP